MNEKKREAKSRKKGNFLKRSYTAKRTFSLGRQLSHFNQKF